VSHHLDKNSEHLGLVSVSAIYVLCPTLIFGQYYTGKVIKHVRQLSGLAYPHAPIISKPAMAAGDLVINAAKIRAKVQAGQQSSCRE